MQNWLFSFLLLLTLLLRLGPTVGMVEGHSVHRVATMHRQRLVGKAFVATSPNGRFAEGAKAIHNKVFYRIEAVGKNLFAFFRANEQDGNPVVCHVHFGMAGNWAVYQEGEEVPEPTATNRLRLTHSGAGLTADLSAMTVNHGGMELYTGKRSKLGQDPLRDDADVELLWTRVKKSKKSIGALIMDQSFFTGPGNIYRAEILFKSGIHPDTPGLALERQEFDLIWKHTVALLQRGYQTGSILTVDPEEAKQLGKPQMRRYIYNTSHCPRCESRIQVWNIASRTCYACPKCQPKRALDKEEEGVDSKTSSKKKTSRKAKTIKKENCVPFNSHCARESTESRLKESGPDRLTVKELKAQLATLGFKDVPKNLRKADLVQLLSTQQNKQGVVKAEPVTFPSDIDIVSSEVAAAEKAEANESLAVEHIAELAPGQARRARAKAKNVLDSHKTSSTTPTTTIGKRQRQPTLVTPSPKKRRVPPTRAKKDVQSNFGR